MLNHMKFPSFPQESVVKYGQFHMVPKNIKEILWHRVLGTGMLFLCLLVLQISYIASFCISGDLN